MMTPPESSMDERREEMVARQIAGRGIHDANVLAAMRAVPREVFVSEEYANYAYDDGPLPIMEGQTISQPYVVALMIQELQIEAEDLVLEIGTGSGYAAAVISRIAAQVYTVERLESLVNYARQKIDALGYDNVHVYHGDGTLGWPEHAPYDAIIVAAGGPEVPAALKEQMAVGGRMIIPVGAEQRAQQLIKVRRTADEAFKERTLSHVRFVPLIGQQGWEKENRKWYDIF
jgi:protein-L-isoaspartate(D-aspartate) O-methyltransferase